MNVTDKLLWLGVMVGCVALAVVLAILLSSATAAELLFGGLTLLLIGGVTLSSLAAAPVPSASVDEIANRLEAMETHIKELESARDKLLHRASSVGLFPGTALLGGSPPGHFWFSVKEAGHTAEWKVEEFADLDKVFEELLRGSS
jgi:hypothetical protein